MAASFSRRELALGVDAGDGEFSLSADTFVKRSLGPGAEQDLQTPAEFFDAAGEIHLIHVALGIQGGKRQIVLRGQRAEEFFFDRLFGDRE